MGSKLHSKAGRSASRIFSVRLEWADMSKTIALIHTSPAMVPVFKPLASELLPGATIFNMVDESLLCDIIREKGCPPGTARRVVGHVMSAEQAGANFILVTCSS